LHIMSFPQILYIWLGVLFIAYASGWVAHIMGRGARHLSGVSYDAHGSAAERPVPPQ